MEVKYPTIDDIDIIEMYEEILKGIRKRFVQGTWLRPDAIPNAIKVTRYLIEKKLKLSNEEIRCKLSQRFFRVNKLGGMLETCFSGSPYLAINTVYPNRFKEWEFNKVPSNFWSKEKGTEATRWLIEEKLKLTDKELKEQLSLGLFKINYLEVMLDLCFNGSPYQAINTVYPNKFKEWEFNKVPNNFWTREKGIEATKWLVEEKLKLSGDELEEKLSYKSFIDNGLGGMLNYCFNCSYKKALQEVYPNTFR